MKQYFPFLSWLATYNKQQFSGDLLAGLTVGVMLIPQGMAYAVIAGLPPIYGLYASTVPLFIYAIFGTSRQLAVGPVAMVSLLTASGIGQLNLESTEAYVQMAILLAFLVGVIKLVMGLLKVGFVVNFLSHPVIGGFTSAAAIIIAFSQLKHLLGIAIPRSNFIHEIAINTFQNISTLNWITLALGLTGILILLGIKRINKLIPAPLILLVFGILTTYFLQLNQQGVAIVKDIPAGLPSFALPSINIENIKILLPTAIAIALVSYMESFAVAKAIRKKHKNYQISANQELIGLGMANLVGSLFSGYPVTGGFSRTAVNDQAGASTGVAAIISGLLIILTLLFLTPLFYYLPKALLASIIMVAVVKLIDIKEAKFLWKANRKDFALMAITFFGTLLLGIETGIIVGVLLSLALLIYKTTKPHIAVLGKVKGTNSYRNLARFDNLIEEKGVLIIRVDSQLYYANIEYFKDELYKQLDKQSEPIYAIIIDCQSINGVDSSAIHGIHDIIDDCATKNIRVFFASAIGPVRDAFAKAGLTQKIGKHHFFLTIEETLNNIKSKGQNTQDNPNLEPYILQTND